MRTVFESERIRFCELSEDMPGKCPDMVYDRAPDDVFMEIFPRT